MMATDWELLEEYKQRLIDRYTASELVEILEIDVTEILEAFEPRWIENKFLLEEVGLQKPD